MKNIEVLLDVSKEGGLEVSADNMYMLSTIF
jgi:hypothetical protein